MIGEIDFFGLLVPPLLLWLLLALPLHGLARRVLRRLGIYRWVWHRPLFDLAVYIIIVRGVAALSAAWGIAAPPLGGTGS
jgi:hypothetical protein